MPASDYAATRRRIISAVARRANITTEAASFALDEFFEQIREEVSRGRVVTFPMLGMFGPYTRRVRGRRGEGSCVRVTPRFAASRSFRLQVRATCPPNATGAKRLKRFAINHAPSKGLQPVPLPGEMTVQQFRESITRQLLAAR